MGVEPLTDAERAEVVRRAMALGIVGTPDVCMHPLGMLTRADGSELAAHVVHAVDIVVTDGTHLVTITRKHPPGVGLPALPGGILDPKADGTAETAVEAAIREAREEVGIVLSGGRLMGVRNFDRPYDVRLAWWDLPAYGIGKDEAFLVSSQPVRFDVPDLTALALHAGDDALSARLVLLKDIAPATFGVPDQYAAVAAAMGW